jgi:hypothetical protein
MSRIVLPRRFGIITRRAAIVSGAAAMAMTPRNARAATETWNPSDKYSSINLAAFNLRAESTENSWRSVRSGFSTSSGKWYYEVYGSAIGWASSGVSLANYGGAASDGFTYLDTGQCWQGGTNVTTWNAVGSNPQIMLLAYDASTGGVWGTTFSFTSGMGTWKGGSSSAGNPATGTNPYSTGFGGTTRFPITSLLNNSEHNTVNFGARPPFGTIPSGFSGPDSGAFASYPAGVTSWSVANSSSEYAIVQNNLRAYRNASSGGAARQVRANKVLPSNVAALFEVYISSAEGGNSISGYRIGYADVSRTTSEFLGSAIALEYSGTVIINGSNVVLVPALAYKRGDVIGVFVNTNPGVRKVWFAKNNVWDGDPSAGTGGYDISSVVPSKTIVPAVSNTYEVHAADACFGSYAFKTSMPTGGVSYDDAESSNPPRPRGIVL